jgi:hypothetical protein
MEKLGKAVKRFILRKRIKMCKLRKIVLNAKAEMIHRTVLESIMAGKDEAWIARLKLEREEIHEKVMELIRKRFELERQLCRAF